MLKVRLDGDVDLYNVFDFKEELKKKLSEKKEDLTMDLGGVSYMDSSAIGMIVEIKKYVEGYGRQYKIMNIPTPIMGLLHKISLDLLLKDNIQPGK
jgi:anti-anti-sigma factor